MILSSKMQHFTWKMEQLDKLIEDQDSPVIMDSSLYNGNIATPLFESATFKDNFTMSLDHWGTSTRKVGA